MTTPELLIDGDIVAYRNAAACEIEIDWGDDFWTLHCSLAEVKSRIKSLTAELSDLFKTEDLVFAFSCPSEKCFRRKLLPTYKHNRTGKRKPVGYQALKQWVRDNYRTIEHPKLEADDLLGIAATAPGQRERIIVSLDKDFRGVPCSFYNWLKLGDGVRVTTPLEAAHFHAVQTLTGDTSDGYSGCPGVGPARAAALLEGHSPDAWWSLIVRAYERAGLGAAEALTQARVARILQHDDFKDGKVKLWTPTRLNR